MTYWQARAIEHTSRCVSGLVQHKSRKVWVSDVHDYPRYFDVSFRTMDAFVRQGLMEIHEPDSFCNVRHAKPTTLGWIEYHKTMKRYHSGALKKRLDRAKKDGVKVTE